MSGRLSESPPRGHSHNRTDEQDDRAQNEKGVARSGQGNQNKAEQGDGRSKALQYGAHRANISTLTAADECVSGSRRWRHSRSAHEPLAACRDEEHGAAALQRTTVKEIAPKAAAARR